MERNLLHLRRNWKRHSHTNRAAQLHLDFLTSCAQHDLTPKGLRIKTRCVALAAGRTQVNQAFTSAIRKAEKEIRDVLINHYRDLVQLAEYDLTTTTTDLDTAEQQASPDTLVRHQQIFKSTQRNITKRMHVRRQTTTGKLDRLYSEKYNDRRPRTDIQDTNTDVVVNVVTQDDPSDESFIVQASPTTVDTQDDGDTTSQGDSATTEIVDVTTMDDQPNTLLVTEASQVTRQEPVTDTSQSSLADPAHAPTIDTPRAQESANSAATVQSDSGLGTSSRQTQPIVLPQRTTKVVRRRKTSPKRFPRPPLDRPCTAVTTQAPIRLENLHKDSEAQPNLTKVQPKKPDMRSIPTQQHLSVTHLPASKALPLRILTRSVGTDPKDPSVFPLAKQKTLLCFEKRDRVPTQSHSPPVEPAQQRPSLPHRGSSSHTDAACQTDHSPSSGSSFSH